MKKFLTFLLLCSFASFSTFAAGSTKLVEPYFEGNIIPPDIINPPLAIDSKQKQNEINEIINLQKHARTVDIDVARYEYGIAAEKFVKAVDPNLTRQKYPHLYNLLMRSRVTAQETKDQIKDHWMSLHPYQVSNQIKALTEPDHFYSYPSGHASKCYVLAYIMSLLIPEEKDAFLNTTEKMMHLRILIGEHFPSDIEAGKELAGIIFEKMLLNKAFQQDLQKAALELKDYHPTQTSTN